jgi:hypothetical protein
MVKEGMGQPKVEEVMGEANASLQHSPQYTASQPQESTTKLTSDERFPPGQQDLEVDLSSQHLLPLGLPACQQGALLVLLAGRARAEAVAGAACGALETIHGELRSCEEECQALQEAVLALQEELQHTQCVGGCSRCSMLSTPGI